MSGDTDALIEWLRSVHAADEKTAREATHGPWAASGHSVLAVEDIEIADVPRRDAAHFARHDPRDTLARIQAEREIMRWHSSPHTVIDNFCVEEGGPCTHRGEAGCTVCGMASCPTVRALAWGYRHRAGWQDGWAP